MKYLFTIVLTLACFVSATFAQTTTAFKAKTIAQRELNDEAKNRLIKILGVSNGPGIAPVEWRLWFYDPYAKQSATMVRVAGGVIVEIQDGYTESMRLASYKLEEVCELSKLKIDSDGAYQALQRSSILKDTPITSLDLELKKEGKGPLAPVFWFATVYVKGANDKEVKVGTGKVSTETGQVIDLKVDLSKAKSGKKTSQSSS